MATKPLRKNDIVALSDIEHVLLRPGMYCGSTAEEAIDTYVYEDDQIVLKTIKQIPGIIKLFDEICSNSVDEAIRTKFKYATKIKVLYDETTGEVSVEDNGRGLPIELDKASGKYTPELIFTQLRAGSNFDDNNKEMLVGQYGVGGSLVPIFSKTFTVETANGHQHYKQTYENHLAIKKKPAIKASTQNFTFVSYIPNYDYFKISATAKKNLGKLYHKRVTDLAFAYPEIQFTFNKEKIGAANLKSFLKKIHEVYECNEVNDGRIGLFYSDTDFQQMSFVNGAYTSRGGTHIDYALSIIVDHVRAVLKKKHKIDVKPIDIKSKLFLILSIRMKNPSFDSQTKERLISPNNFKDLINALLSKKLLDSICKNEEIVLPIVEAYQLKMQVKDNLELKKLNQNKKKVRVEKYYPAVKSQKYLFLAEGDSAANAIMSIVGRDFYSFFALKGKPLNTLEAPVAKIKDNDEFRNIVTILNMRLDVDEQSMLSHDKVVLATDQDLDGISIRALLLCFFRRFSLSLLKNKQICYLKTPLLFGKKNGKIEKIFFSMEEYKTFEAEEPKHGLKFSYMKGLGSWESQDLEEVFTKFGGVGKFIVPFDFDDKSLKQIENWMSGKTSDYRKESLRGKEFNINGI